MTAPDEPCSDATRRRAFTVMREHGVDDHHQLLPWCGVASISRASGVTESQVRRLTAWVEAGCPRSVHRHLGPDQHRVVTYLPDGDVEIATLTEDEYMATTPRPPGRFRGPLVGPVPTPVSTPAAQVVTPSPRPTGRPMVGRVRLGTPSPAPVVEAAPEPEPIVEVAEQEVVVVAEPPLLDMYGRGYVRPCVRHEVEWLPPTRGVASCVVAGRRMPARPGLDLGPEPHGPPCPVALHSIGDLAWWGGRGFHA